jgi:hypothetical protein
MAPFPSFAAGRKCLARLGAGILRVCAGTRKLVSAAIFVALPLGSAVPQNVDCTALRAQLTALDSQNSAASNRYVAAARKQRSELDRTAAYAASLGCDQPEVPFFGRPLPARCHELNARIAQMRANLAQLEGAATSGRDRARQDLVAQYDSYCRAPVKARQKAEPNFFEALFGAFIPQPHNPPPAAWAPPMDESPDVEPDTTPRGGSQAICVRSCDGGFFPLHVSARNADPSYLANLCQALCPGAEVGVYTRPPFSEIDKAVSLEDGLTTYAELPNAKKFRTSYDASCSCKPPQQTWVEALAGAERILGEGRRGDILVTQESSERLSQAKPEVRSKNAGRGASESSAAPRQNTGDRMPSAPESAVTAAPSSLGAVTPRESSNSPLSEREKEVVGPDGVKRRVRIISPTL